MAPKWLIFMMATVATCRRVVMVVQVQVQVHVHGPGIVVTLIVATRVITCTWCWWWLWGGCELGLHRSDCETWWSGIGYHDIPLVLRIYSDDCCIYGDTCTSVLLMIKKWNSSTTKLTAIEYSIYTCTCIHERTKHSPKYGTLVNAGV